MQEFIVGSGCFWCIDTVFRQLKGISASVCGYAGGDTENPTYREVCSGTTGHIEVVKVTFDENIIPAETVLDVFFTSHNPTTWDRQGADVGSQYRSVLFYQNEEQRELFEAAKERAQQWWDDPIVTVIEPAPRFWEAEPIHQDFYANNPFSGYCQAIINPKLSHARRQYSQYLR
ncbi:peptide-methionine (S)-S-oxide reductase MsrA [Rothia sp. LK2588]|uniref:peptide-methionine (S)-S-oxide reductase MsrA n=1 Tax=Rothia sp. LK2588 TaxID=3114369 RepID=UPI0034CF01A0